MGGVEEHTIYRWRENKKATELKELPRMQYRETGDRKYKRKMKRYRRQNEKSNMKLTEVPERKNREKREESRYGEIMA